jgi:hypothetical protein
LDLALWGNWLLVELPVLLLASLKVVAKARRWSMYRRRADRATFLFLVVLELGDEAISNLSPLATSLILNLAVDHGHVLQIGDIVVLHYEDCASYFDYIVNFEWVQSADFSLRA